MCTLLTIDRDTFLADKREFVTRILSDVSFNYDGLSLVMVDPLSPMNNISLNCMAVGHALNMIDVFMAGASEYSRLWLHTRAATTDYVGIPFNHGFTDSRGTIIQHNGIIHNYRDLAVDSFNLVDYRTDTAHNLRDDLTTAMERFANIFLIRPETGTYGVVRMMGGTLFTDGSGNYASHRTADIQDIVEWNYAREHRLIPVRETALRPFEGERDAVSDVEFAWDAILSKKYSKAE